MGDGTLWGEAWWGGLMGWGMMGWVIMGWSSMGRAVVGRRAVGRAVAVHCGPAGSALCLCRGAVLGGLSPALMAPRPMAAIQGWWGGGEVRGAGRIAHACAKRGGRGERWSPEWGGGTRTRGGGECVNGVR